MKPFWLLKGAQRSGGVSFAGRLNEERREVGWVVSPSPRGVVVVCSLTGD